jgi:hypothetical protein
MGVAAAAAFNIRATCSKQYGFRLYAVFGQPANTRLDVSDVFEDGSLLSPSQYNHEKQPVRSRIEQVTGLMVSSPPLMRSTYVLVRACKWIL